MSILIVDKLVAISITIFIFTQLVKFKSTDKNYGIEYKDYTFKSNLIFIKRIVSENKGLFIIAPAIFLLIKIQFLIGQTIIFSKYESIQSTKYIFKSIVDFKNLKELLNFIFLNLSNNINDLNMIINHIGIVYIVLFPIIIFHRFKEQKKNRFIEFFVVAFLLLILLGMFISASVKITGNSWLIINIIYLCVNILSAYFLSYLFPILYSILIDGYNGTKSTFLAKIETMHKKRIVIFMIILLWTLVNNFEYNIRLFIFDFEIPMLYSYNLIAIIISIYFVIMLPRIILLDNSITRELRETTKYLITNSFVQKKILIYVVMFFILNYFLQTIQVESNYTNYLMVVDSFIRFIILYPISIYVFFDFNHMIFKTSN